MLRKVISYQGKESVSQEFLNLSYHFDCELRVFFIIFQEDINQPKKQASYYSLCTFNMIARVIVYDAIFKTENLFC